MQNVARANACSAASSHVLILFARLCDQNRARARCRAPTSLPSCPRRTCAPARSRSFSACRLSARSCSGRPRLRSPRCSTRWPRSRACSRKACLASLPSALRPKTCCAGLRGAQLCPAPATLEAKRWRTRLLPCCLVLTTVLSGPRGPRRLRVVPLPCGSLTSSTCCRAANTICLHAPPPARPQLVVARHHRRCCSIDPEQHARLHHARRRPALGDQHGGALRRVHVRLCILVQCAFARAGEDGGLLS